MQQTPFLAGLSQPFVKLGTLRGMTDVAGKLAVARKAVADVKGIESELLGGEVGRDDMNRAMRDVAELAAVAAEAAGGAVEILRRMVPEVERYLASAEREMVEKMRDRTTRQESEVEDVAG